METNLKRLSEVRILKVVKFGGSSLSDGPHFQKVINIIKSDPERKVVVTSAPGKRYSDDIKVTDLLIRYADCVLHRQDCTEVQKQILSRYYDIAAHFKVDVAEIVRIQKEILNLCDEQFKNAEFLMAAFKAHGEKLNAYLMAKVLNAQGICARFVDPKDAGIVVTDDANNATVLEKTYENLDRFQFDDEVLVFPGFFGYTEDDQIATFSRGGSDITGAILARGFHASLYENFTDVDAIYATSPKIVDHPQPIKKMTYREMRELSYAGFSVFHDEALIPVIQGNIPINVKNTNHPEKVGTFIVPEDEFVPDHIITGIANNDHFSALYIHKYLLNKQVGFTLKILQILYKYQVSYEHMPSGIDDLTIIFKNDQLTPALQEQIEIDIQAALQPDDMRWIENYSIIMVVGEGMRNQVGIVGKIIDALSNHQIAIRMLNQGASKISMMIGVENHDAAKAIVNIYKELLECEE